MNISSYQINGPCFFNVHNTTSLWKRLRKTASEITKVYAACTTMKNLLESTYQNKTLQKVHIAMQKQTATLSLVIDLRKANGKLGCYQSVFKTDLQHLQNLEIIVFTSMCNVLSSLKCATYLFLNLYKINIALTPPPFIWVLVSFYTKFNDMFLVNNSNFFLKPYHSILSKIYMNILHKKKGWHWLCTPFNQIKQFMLG